MTGITLREFLIIHGKYAGEGTERREPIRFGKEGGENTPK
jgi:hypothetical protein